MPFQNTLISRLSSAEKWDHFSFMSATLTKSSYSLRTYVNIIKVLAMREAQFLLLITDFLMPFENTLICQALFREEKRPFFFYVSHPYKIFLFF